MKRKVLFIIPTIFLSICLMIRPSYALEPNILLRSYGSLSWSADAEGYFHYNHVSIQFDKSYEGYINIGWTYNSANANSNPNVWNWVVYGADIYGIANDSLRLIVHGSTEVRIEMVHQNTTTSTTAITYQFTNWNLSDYTETTNYLYTIDSKLASTNSTLSSILSAIDNLEGYTDNIESLLQDIKAYEAHLLSIESDVDSINNTVSYINTKLETANATLTNIKTSLDSLNIPVYTHNFMRILCRNDTSNIISDTFGKFVYGNSNINFTTYLLGLPYCMIYEADGNNVLPVFDSANVTVEVKRTLRSSSCYAYFVYITKTGSNGNFIFHFNNATASTRIYPLYFGYSDSIPYELAWATRGFFEDPYTQKMDEIINSLENLEFNVNDMTVNVSDISYNVDSNDVTDIITEWNTDISNVWNIENNLALTFNTYNERELNIFNANFSGVNSFFRDQSFILVSNDMKTLLTNIFQLDFVEIPFIFMTLAIIIIAVLG